MWDKVFKYGLSKFCGRQSLKNLKGFKGGRPQNWLGYCLRQAQYIENNLVMNLLLQSITLY